MSMREVNTPLFLELISKLFEQIGAMALEEKDAVAREVYITLYTEYVNIIQLSGSNIDQQKGC